MKPYRTESAPLPETFSDYLLGCLTTEEAATFDETPAAQYLLQKLTAVFLNPAEEAPVVQALIDVSARVTRRNDHCNKRRVAVTPGQSLLQMIDLDDLADSPYSYTLWILLHYANVSEVATTRKIFTILGQKAQFYQMLQCGGRQDIARYEEEDYEFKSPDDSKNH
ncbi:MAG: hypothetical protein QY318_01820 [Candidatus Dojkabacteria bacterium]|nr:MAG: hypothetical protein QY318_01820 [Candidatus Dojkabacteria bacterium]